MPRAPFEVSSIVPSMKDFLQAIATRRKRLALVPRVVEGETKLELSRLSELGVAAVACDAAGSTMRSFALGSLPILALDPVREDDDVLAARAYGADAVVLFAYAPEVLGKKTRSTRMVPLVLAREVEEAKRASDLGAKGVLIAGDSMEEILAIVATLPPTTRVLAHLRDADVPSIRALRGRVDAAVVERALALTSAFETLQAEVDPA